MNTQTSYIPINCWKCRAQNNASRNTVCRVCGSHLKLEEAVREDNYSDPVTAHPAFKGFSGICGRKIKRKGRKVFAENAEKVGKTKTRSFGKRARFLKII